MKRKVLLIVTVLILLTVAYFIASKNAEEEHHFDIRDRFAIETVAKAELATGLGFAPDGRLFYSELISGRIVTLRGNQIEIFAQVPNHFVPTVEKGEAGLLALALDPDFTSNGYVYVYYSSGGTSKVARYTDKNGRGTNFTIIFDGIPQGKIHNGGDLEFGADGKLYVSTGDATEIEVELGSNNPAQNISSFGGKILRMNKDGSLPTDNPFPNSYTYVYGLRNVFKFAIHPSGKIYAADQGIKCCDEVNIISAGQNYGWPFEMGINPRSQYTQPIYDWNAEERIVPAGMVFYTDNAYPKEYKDNLFMGTWRTREIYRFILEEDTVKGVEAFAIGDLKLNKSIITGLHAGYVHKDSDPREGILDLVVGPDGLLYFSDVNGIYRLVWEGETIKKN